MNENLEKYLPIGTVCMLKGGSKRVMIAGFCAMSEDSGDKVYDYSGCIYPEGFISSTQTCLFDHEQIDKVYFKGYVDEEEIQFKKKLDLFVKQYESNNNNISEHVNDMNTEEKNIDEEKISNILTDNDDDFIKNFPGPIEDAIKYATEPEEETFDDIIELDEESDTNTSSIMF